MPRKKLAPPDEKPQRERFIEAAREAGMDETGEEFERAFAKIVPPKKAAKHPHLREPKKGAQKPEDTSDASS